MAETSEQIQVLVVEDAAFMREMIKNALRSTFPRFHLEEAFNGRQAQARLEKKPFDLVLCDWEMPEMTGAELLAWIRENEATAALPFVMITSRADKEYVAKAIELKANNFVVKPFTNEKLIDVVTRVLSKAKGLPAAAIRAAGAHKRDIPQGGSAAVLTGAKAASLGLSGAIPIAESSSEPAKKPQGVRLREKTVLTLRCSHANVAILLKAIDRSQAIGVLRRAENMPAILEMVVVDFEVDGQASRLNGYVHALQAREDSHESEFVNITVRLVDQDDAEKMAQLERFMATLK